jgi:integrase
VSLVLTDVQIKKIKPRKKRYFVCDDRGLYLEIMPNGKRFWRFRYRQNGKRSFISLGEYPLISLADARVRSDKKRLAILNGELLVKPPTPTFEEVAREWHGKYCLPKTPRYARKIMSILNLYLFHFIGARPIAELTAPDLLAPLRRVEAAAKLNTAHTALQICGQLFRYAIASGYAVSNPADALRGALTPSIQKHNATLTEPEQIQGLVRAMDALDASMVVKFAVWFSAYTFLRPGEVRHLEWIDVNLESKEIRIPPEKMKMRRLHIVPLARQVIELLEAVRQITGHGRYVFASLRSPSASVPMSENTVAVALRRMGYGKNDMSAHGFRAMASTQLNEALREDGTRRWDSDWIELQLAHVEKNKSREAYNHAKYLPQRREMMQVWADWLDGLK